MIVDAGNVERVLERIQSLVEEDEAVVGSRVAYPLGKASGEGSGLRGKLMDGSCV